MSGKSGLKREEIAGEKGGWSCCALGSFGISLKSDAEGSGLVLRDVEETW